MAPVAPAAIEIDRLLRMRDVEDRVAMSGREIYRRMKKGTFPQAYVIDGMTRWLESEIQQWIRERTGKGQR